MSKSKTNSEKKAAESSVKKGTNGKRPSKTKQGDKICFEEFRGVIVKSFTALDIRPEGQMSTIIQVLYTALATCFPEKFQDVVFYQEGDTPKVYMNTLSRRDILCPYGVDPKRMKRNPIGKWPGYNYKAPKVVAPDPKAVVRSTPTEEHTQHLNR